MEMLKKMTKNNSYLVFRSDVGIAKENIIYRKNPSAIDRALLAV
jgi:hypothetical protein